MPHIQATGFYMVQQWFAVENLTADTISDTQIDLAWDIIQAGMTGIIIEYSTDGVTYSYLDFVGGSEVTYSATGLAANTQYWFRLQGVKSGNSSLYSNTADDWTSVSLQVQARGDGSGVARLLIKVSAALELRLSGSARFYTDAAGTLGESISTTVAATGNLVSKYIRCSSGTCNLQFMDANYLIGFGHAVNLGATNPVWGRSTGNYDSNTPGLIATNWIFPNCVDFGVAYPAIVTFASDIAALSPNLERAVLDSSVSFTGELSDIGENCVLFALYGANTISGNLNTLPSSVQYLYIAGSNTISGDISTIASTMIDFRVSGANTITGDIVGLDVSDTVLEHIELSGQNTVYGDIANLPQYGVLNYISLAGNNVITGDISGLDYSGCPITYLFLTGQNTVYGDISGVPSSIVSLILGGVNTIDGDISGLSGEYSQLNLSGRNTISGNISGVPKVTSSLNLGGFNTISGDIADLSTDVTAASIILFGYNTISGDIANLPTTLRTFSALGYNTLTGDISGFNSLMTNISMAGYNTVYGDLVDLPSALNYGDFRGNNDIANYTSPSGGKTWMNLGLGFGSSILNVIPDSGGGLSSAEIDDLIIDLDASSTSAVSMRTGADLRGNNAPRTSASDAAIASLTSKNITILTNP